MHVSLFVLPSLHDNSVDYKHACINIHIHMYFYMVYVCILMPNKPCVKRHSLLADFLHLKLIAST